jgi:hypothetical protein
MIGAERVCPAQRFGHRRKVVGGRAVGVDPVGAALVRGLEARALSFPKPLL